MGDRDVSRGTSQAFVVACSGFDLYTVQRYRVCATRVQKRSFGLVRLSWFDDGF